MTSETPETKLVSKRMGRMKLSVCLGRLKSKDVAPQEKDKDLDGDVSSACRIASSLRLFSFSLTSCW